jgi:hypothetical protein
MFFLMSSACLLAFSLLKRPDLALHHAFVGTIIRPQSADCTDVHGGFILVDPAHGHQADGFGGDAMAWMPFCGANPALEALP